SRLSSVAGAVLAGTSLAVALQSSTAVALLVSSLAGSGVISGVTGQLAIRGAELGSALVVKLLSFNLTVLIPICFVVGITMFMATQQRKWRQLGRIIVGVGLLILSLKLIGEASVPLRTSPVLPAVLEYFSGDPLTAYLLAAVV